MSKRWKATFWPMATEGRFDSKKKLYEFAVAARQSHQEGHSRIDAMTVYVSEDKGPWQTYERLDFRHIRGDSDVSAQPQTFPGLRGDTRLSVVGDKGRPLTYHDAFRAVLVGLNRAAMCPDDADPYSADLSDIDPVAAAQNAACYLEEIAGIYPNVPPLTVTSHIRETKPKETAT